MDKTQVKELTDGDLDTLFGLVWRERLSRLRIKNGPKIQELRDQMYDAMVAEDYKLGKELAREIEHLSGQMKLP